jgi:hypothetical protein
LAFRPPTAEESNEYLGIVKQAMDRLGRKDGVVLGLSAIFLDRDALFRPELVQYGTPDGFGRVMLQDWELGLAVNHALRYLKPDEELRQSILEGRMRTREDVQRQVERMLDDEAIRKPRLLQFFRDYFDYDLGGYICKDSKALAATGVSGREDAHYFAMFHATASTDRLVELVLAEDKDVLKQLLTTDKVVAASADKIYFGEQLSREETKAAAAAAKLKNPTEDKPKNRPNANYAVAEAKLSGPPIMARVSRRSFGNGSMEPNRMLAVAPAGQRQFMGERAGRDLRHRSPREIAWATHH